MQAVIDYRGYRVVAMPVLPLTDHSLAYGSENGGAVIHTDSRFTAPLSRIARVLHLGICANDIICSGVLVFRCSGVSVLLRVLPCSDVVLRC